MNLVLVESNDATGSCNIYELRDARHRHIRQVLKLATGDGLRVGKIGGPIGTGVVIAIDDESTQIDCTFSEPATPTPDLDLVLCMPRPKALLRMLSPMAQIGVGRIYLSGAYKVEKSYFDSHRLLTEAITTELHAGMSQAARTHVPQVSIHPSFTHLFMRELEADRYTRMLVGHNEPLTLASKVPTVDGPGRTLLIVGPEGGWSPRELRILHEKNVHSISLGATPYRSDLALFLLLAHLRGITPKQQ